MYNGHFREPVTFTPVAERLTVELSLPLFYNLGLLQMRFERPTFRIRRESSNRLRQHEILTKFHSNRSLTIGGEGLQNSSLCSANTTFEERGIFTFLSW